MKVAKLIQKLQILAQRNAKHQSYNWITIKANKCIPNKYPVMFSFAERMRDKI